MADLKISQLNAITTLTPATDVLPVVDVTGTTKKITTNQILGSGGTATLASATISGDLTVDTSTLKVDSANNRVGILTASPNNTLQVGDGSADTRAFFFSNNDFSLAVGRSNAAIGGYIGSPGANVLVFSSGAGVEQYRITAPGIFSWTDGAGGTRMTLSSTGLGVGGSPVTSHLISAQGPIAVGGTLSGTRTSYISNSAAASIYYTDGTGSYPFDNFGNLIIQPRTSLARSVIIATGSTTPVERAVVKSTGQVRFVPLASDPAGAEAGDVYYNSTSNKLKCYNGTTWNDLF
jgi:hypothetical protein